jgi:uncharacterized protein YegL
MNSTLNNSSLNKDVNFDYNFGNFNPNDVEVAETINAVFIVDTSSSVSQYGAELNSALNEFTERMKKSHAAQNLFVSHIEFNDKVNVISGFRPISDVPVMDLVPRIGGYTALFKACQVGLKNALDYRKDLETAGVNCKTLLFIITDGEDNASGNVVANDVKIMIDDLAKEERNFFSFESILFGVGNDKSFEAAQKDMGIKHLAKVGTTADEIRKMINFISSSITSVSTGQGFSAPNF